MPRRNRDECRLIVRPHCSLAVVDLPKTAAVEQISFDYAVYHLLQGAARFAIEERSHALAQYGFAFIPPGKAYRIDAAAKKSCALALKIKPEMIFEIASEMGLDPIDGEIFFLHDSAEDAPALRSLCGALIYEAGTERAGRNLAIDAIATQTAIALLRDWMGVRRNHQLEISRVGMVDRRLRRAIEYMHSHYSRELGLSEIAEAAFLSEYHFARLFKKIAGITTHQYLAAVRIERAQLMLAETDLPIVAISAAVGYSSQSHFTKIFRAFAGFTPAEYRDNARK